HQVVRRITNAQQLRHGYARACFVGSHVEADPRPAGLRAFDAQVADHVRSGPLGVALLQRLEHRITALELGALPHPDAVAGHQRRCLFMVARVQRAEELAYHRGQGVCVRRIHTCFLSVKNKTVCRQPATASLATFSSGVDRSARPSRSSSVPSAICRRKNRKSRGALMPSPNNRRPPSSSAICVWRRPSCARTTQSAAHAASPAICISTSYCCDQKNGTG